MAHDYTGLRTLDAGGAAALERLCEVIVPGSARVGPVFYIDALLARMAPGHRDAVVAAIERLGALALGGAEALSEHAGSPEFLELRALAVEAYYSDFVAPGVDAPGAWEDIGFRPPVAALLAKDWSYLGIAG
jgi:hypothetical protein